MDVMPIDEDELVFEEADPAPEPVPAPVATTPARRRRPARGAAAEPPPTPTDAPVEEAPIPLPAPATTAEIAPAPPPPVGPSRLPALAMALAALAATLSAAGLVATQRNLAQLHATNAEAAERAEALARAPALVAELEGLARRQRAELDRAAASRPPEFLTRTELTRQLDMLRLGLSRMQAPGTAALASKVSAGESELADRIAAVARQVDAMGPGRRH